MVKCHLAIQYDHRALLVENLYKTTRTYSSYSSGPNQQNCPFKVVINVTRVSCTLLFVLNFWSSLEIFIWFLVLHGFKRNIYAVCSLWKRRSAFDICVQKLLKTWPFVPFLVSSSISLLPWSHYSRWSGLPGLAFFYNFIPFVNSSWNQLWFLQVIMYSIVVGFSLTKLTYSTSKLVVSC